MASWFLIDHHARRIITYIATMGGQARYADLRRDLVDAGLIPCATFHKRLKQLMEDGLIERVKTNGMSIFKLSSIFKKYMLNYSYFRERFQKIAGDVQGMERLIDEACTEIASKLAEGAKESLKEKDRYFTSAMTAWLMAESLYGELLDLIEQSIF